MLKCKKTSDHQTIGILVQKILNIISSIKYLLRFNYLCVHISWRKSVIKLTLVFKNNQFSVVCKRLKPMKIESFILPSSCFPPFYMMPQNCTPIYYNRSGC